jgi:hypothetical protein
MALSQFKKDEIAWELRHEDAMLQNALQTRVKKAPVKTVPIQEAMAVAFAAYRVNGEYLKHAQRFSEDKPTRHANKDMVKFYFAKRAGEYVDPDFVDFAVTEEDYQSVEDARNHFKRYTMDILGDRLSGFQKDVFEVTNLEDVPFNKLGLLSYVPELVKREKHESAVKKTIRIEYRDSQHIGKPGDSVEGVIKILDKRYSQQWESYNYTAVMDGNLVSFMNKFDHAVDSMKRVKAKVRDHTKNRLFSADETRLNYVKLYKV